MKSGTIMKPLILVTVILFSVQWAVCSLPEAMMARKERLLECTMPMANIFQDFTVFSDVSLNNLDISADSVKFNLEDTLYKFHYRAIGANFSRLSGISGRMNIYTNSSEVYYIESLGLQEQYDLTIGIGSHFLANDNIIDLHLTGRYSFSEDQTLGLEIMQLPDWQQTDLNLVYEQNFWRIASIKTGIGIHYLAQNMKLSDRYTFPDDELSYRLNASFFQTLFVEPGITFQAGRFYIHQGIRCNAVILTGKKNGIAYQIKPVIQLDYRLF